jgi:hypothetical protein
MESIFTSHSEARSPKASTPRAATETIRKNNVDSFSI